MKVVIQQPNYLPYLGFFQKMNNADVCVLLDTVPFSNDSVTHRVKIRGMKGAEWLTLPISHKWHFKNIADIPLPKGTAWRRKHKQALIHNYGRCKHFDAAFVDMYYHSHFTADMKLSSYNGAGIQYLKERMGINTKILWASDLDIDHELKSTDLLVAITKKVHGDTYITGKGALNYVDFEKFAANEIEIEHLIFEPKQYEQRWEGFVSYMSAIDYVFNRCK